MSSSVSCGIVGLPNAGKSTLFNALTSNNALVANYPFATIEPNTGVVAVPNSKLTHLAELYKTQKVIPASIEFVDIAGLVEGASKGEGMGNQFLSHIRACNVICHVVRAFGGENVVHVMTDGPNPKRDIDIINIELALADLKMIENRLHAITKQAKADPKLKSILTELTAAKDRLENNQQLRSSSLDLGKFKDLNLLTAKPVIYIFNVDEETLKDQSKKQALKDMVSDPVIFINAQIEHELSGIEDSEKQEILASYGQEETGLNLLISEAYNALGLQSFITAGEKEVRAWTIKKGTTAPEAAGEIHGDIQRGFIAAEIVKYHDLIEAGTLVRARSLGKVRTEGKDYIMQPDDIVEFRFNV